MKYLIVFLLIVVQLSAQSQTVDKLIAEIQKAQKNISSISYSLQRSDTFVTGDTRIIKGKALLKLLPQDSIFGFYFWGQREGSNSFAIYDGAMAYDVNNDTKKYDIRIGESIHHILGSPGGQIVFEDLGK